jgi:hypothetical protein
MRPVDDSWALTCVYLIAVIVLLLDLLIWRP